MGAKLIVLRHGEKPEDDTGGKSSLDLAPKGKARAQFLRDTYLGENAKRSPFGSGKPHAFFAVTPHTIQTASPSAESWKLPVTAFCTAATKAAKEVELDRRTEQAAAAIRHALSRGLNVVVVWEHHRIADARQPQLPTLRALLGLKGLRLKATWSDRDFDTMWLVECGPGGKPRRGRMVRQHFAYRPPAARKTGKKAEAGTKAKVKRKTKAKAKRAPKPGRS